MNQRMCHQKWVPVVVDRQTTGTEQPRGDSIAEIAATGALLLVSAVHGRTR